VDVFQGFGKIASPKSVSVSGADGKSTELSTKNILVAVGSTPRSLPFAPKESDRVLNSDSILELDHIPGTLAIIGGGVIGIEFASIFARMGTKVTVIEALPRILAPADADCSKEMAAQLEQQGVKFYTNAKVTEIKNKSKQAHTSFTTEKGESIVLDSDYVLVSIGRAPLTEGIGLEKTKAKLDRGFVVVDGNMQSGEPSIYAIGDCVNTPWLAHIASAEGIIAAEHMAGKKPVRLNYDHTPSCVYSEPQVAWSGFTEEEAKKRGYEVKVGRFDLMRSGKASILGKKRGFVKFVTDAKYGEILGVHIIGPQATELLAEPAFAMQMEATIEDIAATVHAHPTLYESIYEAARVATGTAIHG
jgi:dihydrolipoamide dehydrogenase